MAIELTKEKYLTPQEDAKLRKNLVGPTRLSTQRRDRIMIRLLRFMGMRAGELLKLRVVDVDFDTRMLTVHGTKGSATRDLPLFGEMLNELKWWIESEDLSSGQRLFNLSYDGLRWIWKHYTPHEDKGLHSLRHTRALELYQLTKDIRLVKHVLGHRNIMNTMVYADYHYSHEEIRRAFEQHGKLVS